MTGHPETPSPTVMRGLGPSQDLELGETILDAV